LFENSSKIIQNFFTFKPVIPNLADSCVFEYNKISSQWLFETPHPYPNNFECSRTVQCPQSKYIHYRFNQLKIDSKEELSGNELTIIGDFLKITGDNEYEGQGHSQKHSVCSKIRRSIQDYWNELFVINGCLWIRGPLVKNGFPVSFIRSNQFFMALLVSQKVVQM